MTNVGLIGLPGSGKSTVFQALTQQAVAPQYLGYDLKPHQAVVKIPDARLDWLADFYQARDKVSATIEFVDLPGFDPSSTEQKLMTAVLEHYRKCDALVLVINLFDADAVSSAVKGVRGVLEELVLLGYITAEKAAARLEKTARLKTDKEGVAKYELLLRVKEEFEAGVPLRRMELAKEELRLLREYAFISEKPLIAVLNISDADADKAGGELTAAKDLLALLAEEQIPALSMCAALEADLAGMDKAEAAEYMAEFGLSETVLPRFIRAANECLGLITFLTGSEREVRSWQLKAGLTAQQAAGTIHTDMARGFIRAETVSYSDLLHCGSFVEAKAAGKVRLEGKEYIVSDGDIMTIRFNV